MEKGEMTREILNLESTLLRGRRIIVLGKVWKRKNIGVALIILDFNDWDVNHCREEWVIVQMKFSFHL